MYIVSVDLDTFFTENRFFWIRNANLVTADEGQVKLFQVYDVVHLCFSCMPCNDSVLRNNYSCNSYNSSLLL